MNREQGLGDDEREEKIRLPDSLIDAFLLKRFPGRTLEEIDLINWARYTKAVEAMNIVELEEKQISLRKGLIKSNAISQREWAKIEEHEALLKDNDV